MLVGPEKADYASPQDPITQNRRHVDETAHFTLVLSVPHHDFARQSKALSGSSHEHSPAMCGQGNAKRGHSSFLLMFDGFPTGV
jgi:hypothetical protein